MSTETGPDIQGEKEGNYTLQGRLNTIPLYAAGWASINSMYSKVHGNNEALDSALNIMANLGNSAKVTVGLALAENETLGKVDAVASEMVAKIQGKFPMINIQPNDLADATHVTCMTMHDSIQSKVADSVNSVINSKTAEETCKLAISATEVVIDYCLPSQQEEVAPVVGAACGSFYEQANILSDRICSRGTSKLQTYMVKSGDIVQYATERYQYATERYQDAHGRGASWCKDMNEKIYQTTSNSLEQGGHMLQSTRDYVNIEHLKKLQNTCNSYSTPAIASARMTVDRAMSAPAIISVRMSVEQALNSGVQLTNASMVQLQNYSTPAIAYVRLTVERAMSAPAITSVRMTVEQALSSGVGLTNASVMQLQGIWDQVATKSPVLAMELSADVRSAYAKVHGVNDMAAMVAAMAEKYYSHLKLEQPALATKLQENAVALMAILAHAITMHAPQSIQWIIPNSTQMAVEMTETCT